MNDDQRVRLRGAVELLVSYAGRLDDPSVSTQTGPAGSGFGVRVEVYGKSSSPFAPPTVLTTAQQLALSVLLGDDIPLGVLLSACEDAGVFADGLAGEIAEKARAEERERIAAVCDGCAEACQLGVLSGSDDSRTRQNVYRNIAATARKLT